MSWGWKNVLKHAVRILAFALIGMIVAYFFLAKRNVYWQDMGFSIRSAMVRDCFYVHDRASFAPAQHLLQNAFRHTEKICDFTNSKSELSRLNATAYSAPFPCSDDMWELLTAARRYYRLTHGSFDITCGPLMDLWVYCQREGRMPTEKEIKEVRASTGLDKLVFDDAKKTVRFTIPSIRLGLSAMSRGWTLDRIAKTAEDTLIVNGKNAKDASFAEYLDAWFRNRDDRLNRGYIEAGGCLIALSKPPPKKDAYTVSVPAPTAQESGISCMETDLLGQALATCKVAVMNPETGSPVTDIVSVSVVTKSALDAQVLAMAIFVRGSKFAEELKKDFPDLRVLIYSKGADKTGKLDRYQIGAWTNSK